MAKQSNLETGVDIDNVLNLSNQEDDRYELDARGKFQITRICFDYKTKYWNPITKIGTPIVKIDGFDIVTGERVKYRTLSSVIYKSCSDIMQTVGMSVQKGDDNNEWFVLKQAVNIGGVEKVNTGVKGHNPYLKFMPVNPIEKK